MRRPRVLAIIQAGGQGSRMDVLTRERPKPVLPYAGSFRLIDVPLSNLHHSGVDEVWVSAQFQSQRMTHALDGGRPWDLDRRRGGLSLVVPQSGAGTAADDGFVSGNAEELFQQRDAIRDSGVDAVVVLSADHVYRLDYLDVVQQHLDRGAECTVVTTTVAHSEVSNHAVVHVAADDRVREVEHKPARSRTRTIATEVFVYDPAVLVQVLEELHHDLTQRHHAGGDGESDDALDGSVLGDFGEHLLPALVGRGRVFAHRMEGYWRDLGRPETYVAAHRELLSGEADVFDAQWPLLTGTPTGPPARLLEGAKVERSLLAAGCVVAGTVRDSVIGPGVRIAAGAFVRDSIVLGDVVIDAGARIDWAVVDEGCRLGEGARVGGRNPEALVEPERLTLLGRDCRIPDGRSVPRGARLEPGSTA